MTFSKKDYLDSLDKAGPEKLAGQVYQLQSAQKSSVDAKKLVNHAGWAIFQQMCQLAIEQAEEIRDYHDEVLKSLQTVNAEKMLHAKLGRALANERVLVLTKVLAMPTDLIENGDKATDLLTQIGELKLDEEQSKPKRSWFSKTS
ncbi:hypothetical protein KAR91_51910 [Candidatus Pacearchaeota archaeon]|nr:hypothetical protein [Candidatus Pacearchaeota archaeon]